MTNSQFTWLLEMCMPFNDLSTIILFNKTMGDFIKELQILDNISF